MNEKPLERLNYYNGRPLDAADFKTEQEYHIRTRRWLNMSLYSAGIARGLEVHAIEEGPKKDAPFVAVSPGLALDSQGREIILLEEAIVEVCSYAGVEGDGTVVGNYLVIEYGEEVLEYERGGCVMRTAGTSARKSTTHWGGPSRIEAKPKFSWVPFVPQPGSNQIVLARVELKDGCKTVGQIDVGARRYVGAAAAAKVRQYALEGERHIDANNPGRIYFNIRGQQPNSVSLCLRSEKFSTLYYTETGQHKHSASVSGTTESASPALSKNDTAHYHDPGTLAASAGTSADHNHGLTARKGYIGGTQDKGRAGFLLIERGHTVAADGSPAYVPMPNTSTATEDILDDVVGTIAGGGQHTHPTSGTTATYPGFDYDHTHSLSGSGSTGPAGVTDPAPPAYSARSGNPLTYVDDLHVLIGPDLDSLVDRTEDIRRQLQSMRPTQEDWGKLGGGPTQPDHPLVKKGTGLVRLDFLPNVSFTEGEYVIQLQVTGGGGRIHYNLYVE